MRDLSAIEDKLKEMGLLLPESPTAVANYVPALVTGNLVFLSGHIPRHADGSFVTGRLGEEYTVEEGYELAKKVASNTVEMLKAKYLLNAQIISNKGKDIKTEADYAANEIIINELSYTGIPIISEEGNASHFNLNEFQWIIDPIDGTYNFARGFETSAVSIALWDDGIPVLGVVHHLFYNQVFTARKHQGAFKNGEKIYLNTIKEKNEAIMATGFPTGRDYSKESLDDFICNIQRYKKIRMLGSAALMLAYVASGSFDIYHEEDIYIWDVAAGLALVAEAGGFFNIKPGSSIFKYNVIASNKYLINNI